MKIKSCPFCGKEPIIEYTKKVWKWGSKHLPTNMINKYSYGWTIKCPDYDKNIERKDLEIGCQVRPRTRYGLDKKKEEVIKNWNERSEGKY